MESYVKRQKEQFQYSSKINNGSSKSQSHDNMRIKKKLFEKLKEVKFYFKIYHFKILIKSKINSFEFFKQFFLLHLFLLHLFLLCDWLLLLID